MKTNEIPQNGNYLVDSVEWEDEKIDATMDTVDRLLYHTPVGSGDRHFVDVIYKSGETLRVFEPSLVAWRWKQ
jgi:hypothetical protein